jgi:predicted DNA-binding protein with PD1-like motif
MKSIMESGKITSILLLICIFWIACGPAQKESTINSAQPEKAAMLSEDSAPEIHITEASIREIMIVRIRNQMDMLEALNKAVQEKNIKNAVIMYGIGSLVSYHVHMVSNTTFPHTEDFVKEEGPYDLVDVNGYIIDGRVHAHITLADDEKTVGGHLEPNTRIFTFCAITIGILPDETDLSRLDDLTWR